MIHEAHRGREFISLLKLPWLGRLRSRPRPCRACRSSSPSSGLALLSLTKSEDIRGNNPNGKSTCFTIKVEASCHISFLDMFSCFSPPKNMPKTKKNSNFFNRKNQPWTAGTQGYRRQQSHHTEQYVKRARSTLWFRVAWGHGWMWHLHRHKSFCAMLKWLRNLRRLKIVTVEVWRA